MGCNRNLLYAFLQALLTCKHHSIERYEMLYRKVTPIYNDVCAAIFVASSVADPDPGLNKWLELNSFGACKSYKYFKNLCCYTFWFINILFRAYFREKNFQTKFYSGQDPDPDVFESRIRIRSKIVRIRNTCGKMPNGTVVR
jgi:hypothetical protein